MDGKHILSWAQVLEKWYHLLGEDILACWIYYWKERELRGNEK